MEEGRLITRAFHRSIFMRRRVDARQAPHLSTLHGYNGTVLVYYWYPVVSP